MRRTYSYIALLVLGLFAFAANDVQAADDKKDFTKTIKKDFPISPKGNVSITNKYGKVDVSTWDQARVKVEVKITVRAKDEQTAQTGFDRIEIHFSDTPNSLSAKTEIMEAQSSIWTVWGSGSNIDFNIDYQVFMPETCDLDLNNKYGDSFIAALTGNTSITVKYGNFELEGSEGDLKINLGYGNGTIMQAKDVRVDGKYCNLKFYEANDVDIQSKYSKIQIEEAGNVECNSKYDHYDITKAVLVRNQGKYDNFKIGEIDDIIVISKYTDFKVDHLVNRADCEMKYGGARFNRVEKDFSEINLIGNYTDYKVKVDVGADYHVEADTDYAGLKYPSNMKIIILDKDGSKKEMSGYLGKKDAKSIIKATLDYGGLKVW